MSNMIAISGSPNSGKTTVAIQLATAFAQDGKTVLLVFCDALIPPKEYLLEDVSETSLGHLITASELSSKMILQSATSVSDNLALLGYNKTDLACDFPSFTKTGVTRFLERITPLADVVIFDLTSEDDLLCLGAKSLATTNITVLDSSPKSMVWAKRNNAFSAAITVINQYKKNQPFPPCAADKLILLPYCEGLNHQFYATEMMKPIQDKAFRAELEKLIQYQS